MGEEYITLDDNTLREIQVLAEQLAELYRKQLDENQGPYNAPITASGGLKDFQTTVQYGMNHFLVNFDLQNYWKWVENGRNPGKQPPQQAIERWVEVKKLVPDSRDHKIPNTKQLVYLIARKIGREGYEARHPLQKAQESNEWQTIINEIKSVITNSIKKKINTELKDALSI